MSDCVAWAGFHRKHDGRPVTAGSREYAYRWLWEQEHGPLDAGVILHHKCHNKQCVNLDHLEPMTQGEHLRQHGLSGDWGQRDKTHCPAGHLYDEDNTYVWKNERHCRTCRRATRARYNARLRAARVSQVSGD